MTSHAAASEAAQGFWDQNGAAIETLAVYAGGIMVYALIVNFFYHIISKRVMFGGTEVAGKRRVGGPLNGFLYLILFPLFSFAFFLLLSMALIFLGGEGQVLALTFTLAMAVVLAVRVTAYFSESTSHDVAKMLPLGLLGVILVNAQVADLGESATRLIQITDHLDLVILYFAIVVIVEYLLRSMYLAVQIMRGGKAVPPGTERPPRPQGAHGAQRRRE